MDDNNIEVRKELGEETEQSGAMSARDAWHAKNMNRRQAESAGYRSAYGKNAFDNSEDEQVGKKVNAGKKKPIIIFACIVIGVLILAGLLSIVRGSVPEGRSDISGASGVRGDYIGVLCVEGTIGSDDETYSQSYMIDAVEGMIKNDDNRGMLLFVNTPGGSVYESDELYLKIKEY